MSSEQTRRTKLKGLYGITDPALLPGKKLLSGVEAALRGGAQIIQYRNKIATESERISEASSLRDLCAEHGALFLINDDVDLALRTSADGVHLGKSDGDIQDARTRLGFDKILGVTCHSDLNYAHHAYASGADYCAFGRVFASLTKPHAPPCSLDILKLVGKAEFPSVAIGGINLENATSLLQYEIDMLAVIHGLFGQADIESSARSFSTLF